LKGRGLAVALVEQGPHIAPMQFDAASGEILGRVLEAAGIRIFPGQTLAAVKRRDGGIQGLFLAGGRELAADLVIAAMGVRARTELARKAGLAVNQGVLVNPRLQAGDPAIFAAGDAVETFDPVTAAALVSGLWTNAVEMGKIAGSNMAGAAREYQGAFGVLNSLELAGVATIAIGVTNPPPGGGYEVHQLRRGNNYRKLVFREGRLAGALLLGEIEGAGIYAGLIRGKAQVTRPGEVLERPRAALASRLFSRPATAPRTISS
jgi:NAD(P)H-nitrite reductase large subunit